ncbi:hypothetical protein C8R46DRAFT_1281229 [Mycena filopes]|nr:hypothetical protein C8R46DRAFT_1281229 [Mycena filopes]
MIGVKVDQVEAEETGTPVTMLSFPLLTQLPEPFFREYAELYKVPIHFRSDGTLPRDMGELRSMAMKILLAGSKTANPPAVPVLQSHVAKMVGEVLYVRYRSADPGELGVFPIERLGEPVDDYSDEEMAKVEEKRKKKELKKKQKKAARGPKTMPFVFPPQAGGEKDFLAAMLADLKSESAHAVDMYTKAQVALQEAMYDLACMREETAVERRMWERLWKDVARAAGEDAVQDVALRVQVRVRGGVPDDELDAGIEDGDLEKTRWQTRPVKRSPPPLSPSPPPKSVPLAPPAPPAAALDPVPIIIPTLVNPNSTFGGNATTFDQGAFLKRRRSGDPAESDVDSDSDESDG